jgi:hypothetical protein
MTKDFGFQKYPEKYKIFEAQQAQLLKQGFKPNFKITCAECKNIVNLGYAYLCFYCSLYFCKTCAEAHFSIEKGAAHV